MPRVANRELLVLRYAEARDAGRPVAALRTALVRAYRSELRKLSRAWARTVPGASYDIDDLLQESAIVLLHLLDIDGVRDFDAALRAHVRNRFRDLRRAALRRDAVAADGYHLHARIDGAYQRATHAPELR